ncbi:hypothetical protein PENTCL1PPCAC_9364, partial [Pristionchus entomophagus]
RGGSLHSAKEDRRMEALLMGGRSTVGRSDAIDFSKRLRDGCKVSFISSARVTEEDANDWMALPLLEEHETEAMCARRNFLLLHVPSLREFLHKLDALPPPPTVDQKPIEGDPDIDTNSVVEASVISTVSSVFTASSHFDDVVDDERNLTASETPSATMKSLPSTSPITDSSPFEPTNATSEQGGLRRVIENGSMNDLAEFFVQNAASMQNAVAPDPTEMPSYSTIPPPICTFKIEPAPAVDCGSTEIASVADPSITLSSLIAAAAAGLPVAALHNASIAAAAAPAVADLPPIRTLNAVAVKKQVTVQSPCPLCYVMIEKLDEAKAHIEDGSCSQIGAHACDVCAKRLASKWTLKKHMERHADKPRCVFCSNVFSSLEELRDHNLLSGHMFRPEEAGAGSLELGALRKKRRNEQKEAIRNKESADNLASVVATLGEQLQQTAVAAAGSAATTKQPVAKKRKTTPMEDEAANAVAFLMSEEVQ